MDTRTQRVVLETRQGRIVGDLTMPREGYRSRISDFLNQSDIDFISLTNAQIIADDSRGGTVTVDHEFVAVGTRHIELAYPDE
jgi:hypothetical protein